MTAPSIDNDNDRELNELLEPEVLAELRAGYPTAHYTVVEGIDGPEIVVFQRLSKAQHQRVQGMLEDPRRKKLVASTVFADVVVYPKAEKLEKLLEACPALDDQVAVLALEIARGKMPEEAKKLLTSRGKPAVARPSTPAV